MHYVRNQHSCFQCHLYHRILPHQLPVGVHHFIAALRARSTEGYSGIINFQLSTATSLYLSFKIDTTSTNVSGLTFQLNLYNGTVVSSWQASYFCYDFSFITFISSASSPGSYTASNSDVADGSGYREARTVINFSTGAIDMTHAVYIMPFVNSVYLYRPSTSDNFIFKITLEIINSTSYYRNHATDGNCQLTYASQYRITYDQTAVQATQQTYLDASFFTASNGVPAAYSLVYSSSVNYHAGINHVNFSGSPAPQFDFDTVAFTLSSTGYVFLNLSTINYRYRSCVSPTIYFMQS